MPFRPLWNRQVDIQVNIFIGIFRFEKDELRHHEIGNGIVDLSGQEDDPIPNKREKMSYDRSPRFVCSTTIWY